MIGMGVTALHLPQPAAEAAPISLNTWTFGARVDRMHRQNIVTARNLPMMGFDYVFFGAVAAVASVGFIVLAMIFHVA